MASMTDIAIVGMACRFPGAASVPAFWKLLREGRCALRTLPPGRWDEEVIYDPDPMAPGRSSAHTAGYLESIDEFEPSFFGISPREAVWMDPQQRLILEVVVEALEDAGLSMDALSGTRTGVFIGATSNDYALLVSQPEIIDSTTESYAGIGISPNVISGRVAYYLNWKGPCITVDAACASSLVCVHLASTSLRVGESTLAVAGGVNIIASPLWNVLLTKMRALAPDGLCKAFDARADGYVRGEGAGVVLLKPLEAALRNGDRIYAVIRGSAVLQDGRSNGLTAPNGVAQQDVVREALRDAGIAPKDVRYVEAHGTGTALGDPIELIALGSVLAEGRALGDLCAVGSVKTNIGHLEG